MCSSAVSVRSPNPAEGRWGSQSLSPEHRLSEGTKLVRGETGSVSKSGAIRGNQDLSEGARFCLQNRDYQRERGSVSRMETVRETEAMAISKCCCHPCACLSSRPHPSPEVPWSAAIQFTGKKMELWRSPGRLTSSNSMYKTLLIREDQILHPCS